MASCNRLPVSKSIFFAETCPTLTVFVLNFELSLIPASFGLTFSLKRATINRDANNNANQRPSSIATATCPNNQRQLDIFVRTFCSATRFALIASSFIISEAYYVTRLKPMPKMHVSQPRLTAFPFESNHSVKLEIDSRSAFEIK